jgi:polysaccharide biosynthesis/export protein
MKSIMRYFLAPLMLLAVAVQAQESNPNYLLQPSDLLRIQIFQEPDLDRDIRISQDRTITLPLIGLVSVDGKTAANLAEEIATLYDRDYLVNPQVNVAVLQYAERRVNVLGMVNQPGTIIFPAEENMTLLDAIARAGGFNRLANRKAVRLIRTMKDGSTEQNIVDMDSRQIGRSQWMLQPGDVIQVDEIRW